jgi:ATP-dependent protease HslVU (ClpYQ) peptidase subunit
MTAIVAIADGSKVFMGADSCVSSGDLRLTLPEPKVHRLGEEMLAAACGQLRLNNLVRYAVDLPERTHAEDEGYLIREAIPALQAAFKEAGFTEIDSNVQTIDSAILLGYRGGIYKIGSTFSVMRIAEYAAIGSGAAYALGSLYQTAPFGYRPEYRIERALEAAAAFSSSVAPPFAVLSVGGVE